MGLGHIPYFGVDYVESETLVPAGRATSQGGATGAGADGAILRAVC